MQRHKNNNFTHRNNVRRVLRAVKHMLVIFRGCFFFQRNNAVPSRRDLIENRPLSIILLLLLFLYTAAIIYLHVLGARRWHLCPLVREWSHKMIGRTFLKKTRGIYYYKRARTHNDNNITTTYWRCIEHVAAFVWSFMYYVQQGRSIDMIQANENSWPPRSPGSQAAWSFPLGILR